MNMRKRKRDVTSLRMALLAHYQVIVEAYCDNSDCTAREVTLHLKDHERTAEASIGRTGLTCPLCLSEMKIHWARTAMQQNDIENREARESVNAQMRLRDQRNVDPDALGVLSADEMCDDRLPPTPDGWFKHTRPLKRRQFVSEKDGK